METTATWPTTWDGLTLLAKEAQRGGEGRVFNAAGSGGGQLPQRVVSRESDPGAYGESMVVTYDYGTPHFQELEGEALRGLTGFEEAQAELAGGAPGRGFFLV